MIPGTTTASPTTTSFIQQAFTRIKQCCATTAAPSANSETNIFRSDTFSNCTSSRPRWSFTFTASQRRIDGYSQIWIQARSHRKSHSETHYSRGDRDTTGREEGRNWGKRESQSTEFIELGGRALNIPGGRRWSLVDRLHCYSEACIL